MKQLFASFTAALRVLTRPAAYFRESPREALLFNGLIALAVVAITAAVMDMSRLLPRGCSWSAAQMAKAAVMPPMVSAIG